MGFTNAKIKVFNYGDKVLFQRGFLAKEKIRHLTFDTLVDTGTTALVINQLIADKLGLKIQDTTQATLADGSVVTLNIVGPVWIELMDRYSIQYATVMPAIEQPLLGVLPLEDMDLIIDPRLQQVTTNPRHKGNWVRVML